MSYSVRIIVVTIFLFSLSSCASILSDSSYPFTVNTNPTGVSVAINDSEGVEIFKGASPATVNLKASRGFFKKASYTVHISGKGYEDQTLPVNFKVDGWYFGNLLLGGVIGMLIVDPATGAMYKIEDEYMSVTLAQSNTSMNTPKLQIYDLDNAPIGLKGKLVKITP